MSAQADRVLEILDAGLQSSQEGGYSTDWRPDRCARCQQHEPADGDLCAGCRTFLLGDSDDDPTQAAFPQIRWEEWATPPRRPASTHRYTRGQCTTFSVVDELAWHMEPEALQAAVDGINRAVNDAARAMAVSFSEATEAMTRLFNAHAPTLGALRQVVEAQQADAEPDPMVLRHGAAAYCPRHGQTKGGTCMKCTRRR